MVDFLQQFPENNVRNKSIHEKKGERAMKFPNWGHFTFKTFSTSRNRTHKIDSGKSPHVGMDPKSFHKKSSLHSVAPFKHHTTGFGFNRSPLSPLNPWYNSYFPSRNNW